MVDRHHAKEKRERMINSVMSFPVLLCGYGNYVACHDVGLLSYQGVQLSGCPVVRVSSYQGVQLSGYPVTRVSSYQGV